jgi:alkaline phosphatase D
VQISRRQFLCGAASAVWLHGRTSSARLVGGPQRFCHGVASGDPLRDRVVLWTRVTPADPVTSSPIPVRWKVADDEGLTRTVSQGETLATVERDFTVKVDVGGLLPGRTYYYAFEAAGERSPVGRTRTLPERTDRLRLASVSCSNYPAGYFNVYRVVANRDDIDVVVHLGDYIYEFANGVYGDGSKLGRVPMPTGEAITLADYRMRYATYRRDVDLQEAHRRHPFIAVWDDHELANNAWSGGASSQTPEKGDWAARRAGAYRAYLEWMPVRELRDGEIRLYRDFSFGTLADLIMLDTRSLRDQQIGGADARIGDPARTLLGAAQEAWFFDRLRASHRRGTAWRLVGQQVLFAPITPPGLPVMNTDAWEGYPAARRRVVDLIASERIANVAVLTGDLHSSWALDVPRETWGGYDARTGAGSVAVELVTPAISSPPLFANARLREQAALLRLAAPHLKYLDGDSHGYIVVDVTRERLLAEWHFVPTVAERTDSEIRAAAFVCERGSARLER